MKTTIISALVFASMGLFAQTVQAQAPESRPVRVVLQKTDVGSTGREATLQTVEFTKGAAEVPHTHPGELMGYVLTGSFELHVAGRATTTYRMGDGFMVEGGKVHYGINTADGATKLLVTVILEKGKPTATPVK